MKLGVIGASGFIGSRLVEVLHLGEGPSVVAIARRPSRLALAARFAVEGRIADALDVDALTRALTGCSLAVHLARDPAVPAKRFAAAFARAAARAGLRRAVMVTEAGTVGAAEHPFLAECRRENLGGTLVQAHVVYGPRSPRLTAIVEALRSGQGAPEPRGEAYLNGLYVDNLIAAVRRALASRPASGHTFTLADAESPTWGDLHENLARHLDLPRRGLRVAGVPSPAAARAQAEIRHVCDESAKRLGFVPPVPFAEGVRRSCAWWRFAQGEFDTAA